MANIYRDVTLQNVSENDIGKQMKVSGWVENIRDHGGVSFIDLRDMYGVLQVVIREPELLKGIKKEECISIDGPTVALAVGIFCLSSESFAERRESNTKFSMSPTMRKTSFRERSKLK